jgi:hypothetical protein
MEIRRGVRRARTTALRTALGQPFGPRTTLGIVRLHCTAGLARRSECGLDSGLTLVQQLGRCKGCHLDAGVADITAGIAIDI